MFEAERGTFGNRWPVVRIRAGNKSEVVLLSPRFFSITTHFTRCTVPCAGDACKLCEVLPARGLFYVAVLCMGRLSLLELGAASSGGFEQHAKFSGGGMTPGQVFELSRRGNKSPIYSELVRRQDVGSVVTHLDLAVHVMALYKFPPANPEESIEQYEVRCRLLAQRRNEFAAKELLTRRRAGT